MVQFTAFQVCRRVHKPGFASGTAHASNEYCYSSAVLVWPAWFPQNRSIDQIPSRSGLHQGHISPWLANCSWVSKLNDYWLHTVCSWVCFTLLRSAFIYTFLRAGANQKHLTVLDRSRQFVRKFMTVWPLDCLQNWTWRKNIASQYWRERERDIYEDFVL